MLRDRSDSRIDGYVESIMAQPRPCDDCEHEPYCAAGFSCGVFAAWVHQSALDHEPTQEPTRRWYAKLFPRLIDCEGWTVDSAFKEYRHLYERRGRNPDSVLEERVDEMGAIVWALKAIRNDSEGF